MSLLEINRPIEAATFAAPRTEPGVVVQDQTSGKDEILGGRPALEALVRKYGAKPTDGGATPPVTAPIEAPDDAWGRPFLFASAAALVTAGLLIFHQSRRQR